MHGLERGMKPSGIKALLSLSLSLKTSDRYSVAVQPGRAAAHADVRAARCGWRRRVKTSRCNQVDKNRSTEPKRGWACLLVEKREKKNNPTLLQTGIDP